jgi:hypothetical protein
MDHSEDLCIDGEKIIKYILEKQGPVVSSCEYSNETLGSIKVGNFLTS